ncbi:MAG: mRNA surveillance protein pelota [Fervidicoccaceae archaeon]
MLFEFSDPKKKIIRAKIESSDDLWILYTLLKEGDQVTARTLRDVKQGEGEKGKRVPMILTIELKHMEFQPFTNKLRMRGIVIEGPDTFGLLGSHHTISVGVGDEILIYREEGWSSKDIRRLEESAMKLGSVIIVALDYDEVAIGVYRRQGLKKGQERDLRLPGKGDERREIELNEAIKDIVKNVVVLLEKEGDVVGVIVAGPGFLKEKLATELSSILKGVPVVLENASMGGYAGLREVVSRGKPAEVLRSQELAEINAILERMLKLLSENPGLVAIGIEECEKASIVGSIETSLVLDELLSIQDNNRTKVESILEKINSYGGKIHIVPSSSPAGERLSSLGGIICLLRFPLAQEYSE